MLGPEQCRLIERRISHVAESRRQQDNERWKAHERARLQQQLDALK